MKKEKIDWDAIKSLSRRAENKESIDKLLKEANNLPSATAALAVEHLARFKKLT